MPRSGIARTRHLRHRKFFRSTRTFNLMDWLATVVTTLSGTGATITFTADNTTNQLTATGHGRATGAGPIALIETAGTLPAGLSVTDRYWLIVVDANTLQLASSRAAAAKGVFVAFSDDGSGTLDLALAAEGPEDIFDHNSQGHRPEEIDSLTDIDNL